MNFSALQAGDIVFVVPMRQPARSYYAKVVHLPEDERGQILVKRWINARSGYNIRNQGKPGVPAPRFSVKLMHVWAHEIDYIVRRDELHAKAGLQS